MPLSEFERQRIISLWTQFNWKATYTAIKAILAKKETITSCQTVHSTLARWKETGSVRDHPRIQQAKTIPLSHYRLIDDAMADNDEHTAGDLKKLLIDKFGEDEVTCSERTIARARNDLGWVFTTARYC